jgi:hypothetical protein
LPGNPGNTKRLILTFDPECRSRWSWARRTGRQRRRASTRRSSGIPCRNIYTYMCVYIYIYIYI